MRLTSGGESHGKELVGIIEGMPANLKLDIDEIDAYLALRQGGYGRGDRQKIETDRIEILSGVRDKETLGSPLAFCIKNKDYDNWKAYMAPEGCDVSARRVTKVRPGHADLTGLIKYDQTDARNVLERASARETAVRVAAGSVARQLLRELGVAVSGYVVSVCDVKDENRYSFSDMEKLKDKPLFMPDEKKREQAMKKIDELKAAGDTAGGVVEVRVKGLKCGFGGCMTYADKLDARLCAALMSVQAVKGVEVGEGFEAASHPGSEVHDEIFYENDRFVRRTDNAGGIEGGMSNGEEIILRAAFKPIPTLRKGLDTVDYATKEPCKAAAERSDVCAINAAEIIAESVVCFEIASAVCDRIGSDNMRDLKKRYGELG